MNPSQLVPTVQAAYESDPRGTAIRVGGGVAFAVTLGLMLKARAPVLVLLGVAGAVAGAVGAARAWEG